MKKVLLLVAVLAGLALAPAANAGCFASVKLSSMPSGKSVWNVRVTPLQHGRTLLPNARPRIEIRSGAAAKWIVFRARKTKRPGTFAARVVFPAAGSWQLRVWDGFEPHCAQYHTYAPVLIGLR
jgi:hypothetical protein